MLDESLADHLKRRGPFPVRDAVGIIIHLVKELENTSRRPPIHGAIDPHCIILLPSGPTFSHWSIDPQRLGQVPDPEVDPIFFERPSFWSVSDAPHASPEQLSGSLEIDMRSDQYSLASTLFELLAGRPPFVHENRNARAALACLEPPPALSALRPGVPRAIERAIARALSRSPQARFATHRQFVNALQPV